MTHLEHLAQTLSGLSIETLAMFVGLGALGLAAFAIHAVTTIARRRKD
jgi:hypothetical protein